MSKTTLLVSTAVGLTLAVAPAMAAKRVDAKGQKTHVTNTQIKYKNNQSHSPKKAKGTVMTWSTSTTYGFGFFLDPSSSASISCKKACTIISESIAQALLEYTSYEQTAICPVVDGYFTNGSCYFSGAGGFSDLYHNLTNDTNISTGSGSHSLEVYLYSAGPAYWGHRQNQWHT